MMIPTVTLATWASRINQSVRFCRSAGHGHGVEGAAALESERVGTNLITNQNSRRNNNIMVDL
jgi:hypothetical protein